MERNAGVILRLTDLCIYVLQLDCQLYQLGPSLLIFLEDFHEQAPNTGLLLHTHHHLAAVADVSLKHLKLQQGYFNRLTQKARLQYAPSICTQHLHPAFVLPVTSNALYIHAWTMQRNGVQRWHQHVPGQQIGVKLPLHVCYDLTFTCPISWSPDAISISFALCAA